MPAATPDGLAGGGIGPPLVAVHAIADADRAERAIGEVVGDAITGTITTLPEELRRSLTWDQGSELAQHARLRVETGLVVYFCDPHSPWPRGSNENTNGLLRRHFRRGRT